MATKKTAAPKAEKAEPLTQGEEEAVQALRTALARHAAAQHAHDDAASAKARAYDSLKTAESDLRAAEEALLSAVAAGE
ncbi:MAG TPA: hypothetical protein VM512_14075 [Burkholderiaceae bacterium]|jgi:hypothetical protein|nr:hypothetical protein [Burkholderiaceae bacterium]